MARSLTLIIGVWVVLCGCAAPRPESAQSDRWVEPETGMAFIKLEAGAFLIGSPPGEIGREAQESQRAVPLSRSYWLGVFEVTQHEWQAVMVNNSSHFRSRGDRLPVENVTWFDVHTFLERLTQRSPGNRFRLPTEAENVAESVERTAVGDGQTMPAGSFAPNAWELHYYRYTTGPTVDPSPRCGAPLKVIRGGSGTSKQTARDVHSATPLAFSPGSCAGVRPASPCADS
ncbi:MAG: hypothetical protein EXQ49_08250 [Acidobacteria bacterium]|nr:hypothetical protein [Acidobacteriota bacterium]